MSDTVVNSTGAMQWDGLNKVGIFSHTFDFSKTNCEATNTLSVLLPANVIVLGGTYQVVTAGTATCTATIGITGDTDYLASAGLDVATAGAITGAQAIATPVALIGATNYLVYTGAVATAITGKVKCNLILAQVA